MTSSIATATSGRAIDLAGRTSLGGHAALVSKAQLVVCNDTGMSHVAAATKTRSIVIGSGSDSATGPRLIMTGTAGSPTIHHVGHVLFATVPTGICARSP